MKSNYEPLGKHIRLVDYRNSEEVTSTVLGISIDKEFMPSVANVIGTDLSRYKLISKGLFACNPMHVGRDERLPIALYEKDNAAIVSPAYFMFEIIDRDVLNEEYLMMWFRRPEFDRECWFMTDGSVRGGISWDDLCRIQLPVPPYERQLDVVESYRAITRRIAMKKEINDNVLIGLMQLGTRCSDGSCEAAEDLISGFSAIEAEAELVQIGLKLCAAAVISAEQECFQVADGFVQPVQVARFILFRVQLHARQVLIASVAVAFDFCTCRNSFADDLLKCFARDVFHDLHPREQRSPVFRF